MTDIDHSSRAHALLSASSAHRWLNCPSSAVAAQNYKDEGSPFAAEGTIAHEVAELTARGATLAPFGDVTDEMVRHAEEYRDYVNELKLLDDAVVLLEQRVDFSPWVPHGFGTCDCILIQGSTLTIIDYKYGKGVQVDAKDNPQMKLYALGALNDFGLAYDVDTIEMHIFQPRIGNISTDCLTADELTKWAEKTVKPIAAKAAQGKGGYKAGDWCKFCPHAGKCRALTKTCTEYVETHGMRVSVPVLAPHEVAEVLTMGPLVSLWLKRVRTQALNDMLAGKEVPGYKVVEGKQGNRKWTDELQVLQALTEAGHSREDVTETKLLSPAGMDKAIGKAAVAGLLSEYISRAPGEPTIAPETDKRPVYDRVAEAVKDFA